jgi:hypothetical protein
MINNKNISITIQNEGLSTKEFQNFLYQNLNISNDIIDKYNTGFQIHLSKHYFENLFNNLNLNTYFKNGINDFFECYSELNNYKIQLDLDDINNKIFKKYKITFFVNEVL